MVRIEDQDQRLTGCLLTPVVGRPVIFAGGTVLSFNASLGIGPTQESSVTVELINDCSLNPTNDPNHFPDGDHFYGAARIGSPVWFSTCPSVGLAEGISLVEGHENDCFEFGGILQSYEATQSSAGEVFSAKIIDPRALLNHAIVITDSYLEGPIKHRNYFNAYAYYEYNILPTGIKSDPIHPTGIPVTGILYQDQNPEGKGLVYSPYDTFNQKINIAGDPNKEDCSVYGSADRTDRGMTARKVVQAIKDMNPLIFSPNYGEPYRPNLRGQDIIAAAGRLHHELNVFQLDMSGFPEPPPYMRIAGPSITILELLTQICDVTGREFIVSLIPGDPGDPYIIKIETKNISGDVNPQDISDTILSYNGRSTEISFGEELRTDKSRTILLGEKDHTLVESSHIQFFFGEDRNGDPIVPLLKTSCGFEVAFDVNELNDRLNCPLFDPDLHDAGVSLSEKVLKRKVVVSEWDIRTALSTMELWKCRVGAESEETRTQYPDTHSADYVDFNTVLRYNFQDIITAQIYEALQIIGINATDIALKQRENFFDPQGKLKAALDATQNPSRKYVANLISDRKRDLEIVYDWLREIGNTYYGKQYIVTLPAGVCSIPEGLYDENYFGIGTGNIPASLSGIYIPPKCSGQITDTSELNNKIYRPLQFTHIPTNDGGWAEPCTPVLGLYEPQLSFFKTDDFRVKPFARFSSKDVRLKYEAGFIGATEDGSALPVNESEGDTKPAPSEDHQTGTILIRGTCGQLDMSEVSPKDYIVIRASGSPDGGICDLPGEGLDEDGFVVNFGIYDNALIPSGYRPVATGEELPLNIWIGGSVDETLYVIKSGTIDPSMCDSGYCDNIAKAVIKFDQPCVKKPCTDTAHGDVYAALAVTLANAGGIAVSGISGVIDPNESDVDPSEVGNAYPYLRDSSMSYVCGIMVQSGLFAITSSLDSSSVNNKRVFPPAEVPQVVCLPLMSNISSYGPWYSPNFNDSAGGIEFTQNNDFAPWNYGSTEVLEYVATETLRENQIGLTEIETGSITYPGAPTLKMGFLENGPNLTNINVAYGSNGLTTNYVFQTYTPKFGQLKTLEAQQLREAHKNRIRAQRIIADRIVENNRVQRKLADKGDSVRKTDKADTKLSERGTLQRIIMGEMYDFSVIQSGTQEEINTGSGTPIGTGQRVVVGTDTLEKSALEMRLGYDKKAYMSLDGLFSPVSISGDGDLPMFPIKYSGYTKAFKSSTISPNPPVKKVYHYETIAQTGDYHSGIAINNTYLNPLQNHFADGEHPHHSGAGAGHCIDIVGRGTTIPDTGMMMTLYPQKDWDNRYTDDYRFLGMRGPLVLHSWGYDTDGKPVPNYIDDENDIRESGILQNSGLTDYFLQDWLHKPATWPVAPIDLRYDRERGVWVSPPQHKIVVASVIESVPPYGQGSGIVITGRGSGDARYDYSKKIFDEHGKPMESGEDVQIVIEDRLGVATDVGTKQYAYFDNFTSTYVLLGGGGGTTIRLGQFTGAWPNEPGHNVKNVKLFTHGNPNNPSDWIPELDEEGKNVVAVTLNFMSYIPSKAGSDRNLWCSIVPISFKKGTYNGLAYDQLWLLVSAEC